MVNKKILLGMQTMKGIQTGGVITSNIFLHNNSHKRVDYSYLLKNNPLFLYILIIKYLVNLITFT